MIRNIALIALSIALPLGANAGELIKDATIVEVSNTSSGGPDFAIILQGGTGVCASTTTALIKFPEPANQSDDSYKQAFSLALSALTTGMKVRVHNFADNSCAGASFIAVSK